MQKAMIVITDRLLHEMIGNKPVWMPHKPKNEGAHLHFEFLLSFTLTAFFSSFLFSIIDETVFFDFCDSSNVLIALHQKKDIFGIKKKIW